MKVIGTARRVGYYKSWEPIFIGTNNDPLYDERMVWEGSDDKLIQVWNILKIISKFKCYILKMYILCLLEYEFHVLNNGFLIHKPGIKTRDEGTFNEKCSHYN